MTVDQRIAAAREYVDGSDGVEFEGVDRLLIDLLEFAEERLRVNAGLVRQNEEFRNRLRAPETVDLSTVSREDLLAEVERRLRR